MPELAFVLGPAASPSLVDLADALAAEVSRQDAAASVAYGFPEMRLDRVAVIFDDRPETERAPQHEELARTIAVTTAAPGSEYFAAAAHFAGRAGSSFHVNSMAVGSLHEAGVPARHLQLGYSTAWAERDPDPDGLAVITGEGYFDWVEVLAAIHRGDAVLHERCLGMAPLVPGRDLFVAAPESVQLLAEILRGDRGRLEAVREEAVEFFDGALPLALAAAALVGAARALVAQPFATRASSVCQPAA